MGSAYADTRLGPELIWCWSPAIASDTLVATAAAVDLARHSYNLKMCRPALVHVSAVPELRLEIGHVGCICAKGGRRLVVILSVIVVTVEASKLNDACNCNAT